MPSPTMSDAPASGHLQPQNLAVGHDGYFSSDETTRAPSTAGEETEKAWTTTATSDENEKKDANATGGSVRNEPVGQDGEQDETKYPTGLPLTFIIIALVLSIFLVSLDMVRLFRSVPFCSAIDCRKTTCLRTETLTLGVYLRQSWPRPFPKSRTSSMG